MSKAFDFIKKIKILSARQSFPELYKAQMTIERLSWLHKTRSKLGITIQETLNIQAEEGELNLELLKMPFSKWALSSEALSSVQKLKDMDLTTNLTRPDRVYEQKMFELSLSSGNPIYKASIDLPLKITNKTIEKFKQFAFTKGSYYLMLTCRQLTKTEIKNYTNSIPSALYVISNDKNIHNINPIPINLGLHFDPKQVCSFFLLPA